MFLDWRPRKWEGPFQYEDMQSQELVMLPSDMALKEDPEFRKYAELYARDNQAFFRDFARAYAKLLSNGGPPTVCPFNKVPPHVVPRTSVDCSDQNARGFPTPATRRCDSLSRVTECLRRGRRRDDGGQAGALQCRVSRARDAWEH
jgi:hypothetical protein